MAKKKARFGDRLPFAPLGGIAASVAQINENFSNIFINLPAGGQKFGSWIDENSRSNGYNEDDVITNPAYVIESVLRDVLSIPTDDIDYASFDVAGNDTDGLLDGWRFNGGIYTVVNSRELLTNMLLQCQSRLFRDADGKFSMIVYDSSATVDYSDYKFDSDNNIGNVEISRTSFEDIAASINIKYDLDRGANKYRGSKFVWARKEFSGTYLNEVLDATEFAVDVDDGTKFQKEDAAGALTAALAGAGAGNLDNAAYTYKVTFLAGDGETEAGTVSNTLTIVDNGADGQAALTGIPIGNSSVTARKIYRTEGGGSTYKLLTTISDNTTTTFIDNVADGALGATAPTSNDTLQAYIMYDREINKVLSVTGNTVTLVNAAAARTVFFNTNKVTHDDDSPIYIITKDSNDSDTTKEDNIVEAIWKYNAQNKIDIEADWIADAATAELLRDYYYEFYRLPHWIVDFTCTIQASNLKVGNVIEFDDTVMDSFLKLGGESWSGKVFRVESISRVGNMLYNISVIEI